jgi:hypothetical protein
MVHIRGVSCEADLISGEMRHVVQRAEKLKVFDHADSVATYPTTAFLKG